MIIDHPKYPMTDDLVRRKLFWLLQRLSSYGLWRRKRDAWAYFAERYEQALKTWPEDQSYGFDPEAIIWIYDALRLYDQGLPELARGNRQVWQRKTGEFHQLGRPVDLVGKFFYTKCHERWSQVMAYPPAVEKLNKLRIAAGYRGDNLLFPPYNFVCNFFWADYLMDPEKYRWEFETQPYPVFPQNLPPVPERHDIIILTGDAVPCDGIWEPVTIKYHHKLLVIRNGISGFKNLGAFNYFIRHMKAPRNIYADSLSKEGFDYRYVHWRLVWEDTRYCDGIIPDESEYFLDDKPGKRITAWSGAPSPHSGRWGTLIEGTTGYAQVIQGQNMPEFKDTRDKSHHALWSLLERDDNGDVYLSSEKIIE